MKNYLEECPCGSGREAEAEFDARSIFLCYACTKCRKEKLSRFRADILTDASYLCDENIDDDY